MADAKTLTFESIMQDLKARRYAPVYYLMGDEPYYIDKIADYLADNVLRDDERDFNMSVMFGSDVNGAQVADAARQYPMMAEHILIIVKEAQLLKQTEALERYLEKPSPQTVLVLVHKNGSIDRRRNMAKLIEKVGIVYESKKIKERDLVPFIENQIKMEKATIDPKSAQIIADSVGSDLSRLMSELKKLVLALSENDRRVTPELVEQQIGVSKDFNSFELKDAVVNRNVYKANQIINYFDKNPKAGSLYAFLPMLFNFFQNLMIAYYCPQRQSREAVAKWLELRTPWAAKDYMIGMRNFTGVKVMQIISKIREIDAKSKGLDNPNTPAGELMKELIFFILH